MINALTIAYEHYLGVPFESFTDKYISAMGLIAMIDNVSVDDAAILSKIERLTDDKIRINFYVLDRTVNPTKGEFKSTTNKVQFNVDNEIKTYTENQIQKRLCVAIRKVHEIIMRYMKNYKMERSMGSISNTQKKIEGAFDV